MKELSNTEREWLAELVRLGFCYTMEGSTLDQGMQRLVAAGFARKERFKQVYYPTGSGIKFVEK